VLGPAVKRRIAASGLVLAITGLTAAACVPVPKGGAKGVLARMTLEQRVGQLFMVGNPATSVNPTVLTQIGNRHIGSVVLTSRSYAGIQPTANITNRLQWATTKPATAGVPLFVATDQEGGLVQVLNGPGFSAMPRALTQGGYAPATLRSYATVWGRQLRAAGVNVDLGPVMDTVPSPSTYNPPIGYYQREFGFTPTVVATHGAAVVQGLQSADVAATIKHFPGLGRVNANTDTSSGVTDTVTSRGDSYVKAFGAGINAGAQFVMMSTAYYSRMDPGSPAAFSPSIIGTVLRKDLHFKGVVISDDLGGARQVTSWSPANRAVVFIAAGGDMVLTVDPSVVPAMYDTVLAYARANPTFRNLVNQAALRVLTAKQQRGLIAP
jgi:beta-N-acetylhexosaminidase